jgi:hypothetical protein
MKHVRPIQLHANMAANHCGLVSFGKYTGLIGRMYAS